MSKYFESNTNQTNLPPKLQDEEFLKRLGFLKKKTGVYNSDVLVILNIYLDHLYEEKRYSDVLASFDEINAKIAKPAHLVRFLQKKFRFDK